MALALGVSAIVFLKLPEKSLDSSEPSSTPAVVDAPGAPQAAPSSAAASTGYSAATQAKLQVLDEILRTRNDNDPRMDQDLKNLSAETKAALKTKYFELPLEDRNGKGTIVFLMGREASAPEDMEFFRQVLSEAPCFSLSDCNKSTSHAAREEAHLESSNEVTLAYPQLVALRWIDELLSRSGSEAMSGATREAALKAIQVAKESRDALVARRAQDLEKKLGNRP